MRFEIAKSMEKDFANQPIFYDTSQVINGHILVVGKSGSGKTTVLKDVVTRMVQSSMAEMDNPIRIYVMDPHGDIDISNASECIFSESTPYGFNPLEVHDDPHFGGVRKKIQGFLNAINSNTRQLGNRQEAVLRSILQDLYAANGFYPDQPKSWSLYDGVQRAYPKKYPTLADAVRFTESKFKSMYIGGNSEAVLALENVNKRSNAIFSKIKKNGGTPDAVALAELDALKKTAADAYNEYLFKISNGKELDDLLRYDSREVLKTTLERLQSLNESGIFKNEKPPFDQQSQVWRYNIKALSSEERKLFVTFFLEDLFFKLKQRPIQEGVPPITDIVVLDEAHMYNDPDPDAIINIVAKEARKFGLGLILASQSPTHFSEDFLSNVSTKILLKMDEMYWQKSSSALRIPMPFFEKIIPTRNFLLQMNTRNSTSGGFVPVRQLPPIG